MSDWIKTHLAPPVFEDDEDKTRVAALLNTILRAMLIGALLASPLILIASPEAAQVRLIATAVLILLTLALLALTRRGHVRFASAVIVIGVWAIVALAIAGGGGGVRSLGFPGNLIVVVMAGVLLGRRAAVAVAGLAILTGLAFVYARSVGAIADLPAPDTDQEIWIIQSIYLVMTAVLLGLALRSIDDALARARRELVERHRAEEALRRAEEKYRDIVENAVGGIFQSTRDGRFLSVNPAMAHMYGYATPDDMVQDVADIASQVYVDPAARAELQRRLDAEDVVRSFEMQDRRVDGQVFWTSMHVRAVRDAQGNLLYYEGMQEDITERKQAERQIRQYADIVHNMQIGMYILRAEDLDDEASLRVVAANPAALHYSSKTAEEVLGRRMDEVFRTLRAKGFPRAYLQTLRTGIPCELEDTYYDKAGNLTGAFLVKVFRLAGESVCVLFENFTERKRAEDALQRYTERLEILREIDHAILAAHSPEETARAAVTRIRRIVLTAARASVNLFDFQARESILLALSINGDTHLRAGGRVSFEDYGARIIQDLQHGQPYILEDLAALAEPTPLDQRLLAEGLRFWLVVPLRYQGNLIGALNLAAATPDAFSAEHIEITRDVANQMAIVIQQSRLFEAVQKLNTELEARVQDRTAQLEAANQELEAFSYSVSHDLRAPLRGIDGFSRILLQDYAPHLDADGQRHLQRVRANAQRMGQLIDDLLEFSRLSRQALRKQTVDPAALARQVLDDLKPDYAHRPVEIVVGDLSACEADPALLRQVWANLIGNALKYSSQREPARVEVGWRDGAYFVRDNGVGFDMRYADKLFRVFQRLHSAEEFDGTGVGLAIVQRIVHRHGGRIWAEAEVGQGATFYFTLGAAEEAQP